MGYGKSVPDLFFDEGDVVGLLMRDGATSRRYYFETLTKEQPVDLADYSIGTATALDTAGTTWSEIADSQSRYHLEPPDQGVLYQYFYGISPGQAWVYTAYPPNLSLYSLQGVRAIGSGVGHVDGFKSPYRNPSPITETFTLYGAHTAYLGYNPNGLPSSITVRLYFYLARFDLDFLGVYPGDAKGTMKVLNEDRRRTAKHKSVGGRNLISVPTWIQTMAKGA